jgi:hypothetical protein
MKRKGNRNQKGATKAELYRNSGALLMPCTWGSQGAGKLLPAGMDHQGAVA